jgi:hypothetical protein
MGTTRRRWRALACINGQLQTPPPGMWVREPLYDKTWHLVLYRNREASGVSTLCGMGEWEFLGFGDGSPDNEARYNPPRVSERCDLCERLRKIVVAAGEGEA